MRGGFERFDVSMAGTSDGGIPGGATLPSGSLPGDHPMDFWSKNNGIISNGHHDTSTDSEKSRVSVCTTCHLEIVDRFILRVHPNLEFHANCLRCTICARQLDEKCTTFVKNGATYCKEDYQRLFMQRCNRCEIPFKREEMVMRIKDLVFHLGCFQCPGCERQLQTGDECQFKGDSVFCKNCDVNNVNIIEPSSMQTPSMFADDDAWETSTLTSLDQTSSPPLSIRSPKSDGLSTPLGNGFGYSSSGGKKKKEKQTTRIRTVLNENQLLILKKCYLVNPRPDALLKEQLVEMTGLNARVIRVWFQNKRCKDKKRQIQIRDYQVNAEKERALNHVRASGLGPMMAAPPTTHIDNLGPPMDISHFQQWGAPVEPMSFSDGHGMPYSDLIPDMSGYSITPTVPNYQDYSPNLHASDLSSPSCSE